MLEKINHKTNVWDLHIHTCHCTKPSKEFGLMNVISYIDNLLSIYKKYPNLTMISFTDHNNISSAVYNEFYSRKSNIKLIPGIEIDVTFTKNTASKHLLVYFDDKDTNIDEIAKKVNLIIYQNKVSDTNPIDFSVLIQHFIDAKLTFLLSPHAFKQGKRGINHEWKDEDSARESSKYANQFFCFWETSGYKEINNAKVYMQEFLEGKEQSIVSFSDSSTFDKITNYLDNPPVYFTSMSTFRGIQLVGTDSSRIKFEMNELTSVDKSKIIGKVIFNGVTIELSSRLNSIIGGRGSGKSILIDRISLETKSNQIMDNSNRKDFLNKYSCILFDMNGKPLSSEFEVDYFNQSYVSKIFEGKNPNEEIKKYFKKEFSDIIDINTETILLSIKSSFAEKISHQSDTLDKVNIGDLIAIYSIIDETDLPINLLKKDIVDCPFIPSFDIEKQIVELKKPSIIPKVLLNDDKINKAIATFIETVIESINEYNNNLLNSKYLMNQIISNYHEYKGEKSEEAKTKSKTEKILKSKLKENFSQFVQRVKIVNAIIETHYEEQFTYTNYNPEPTYGLENIYRFTKEFIVESPVDFFLRTISSYVSKNKYHTKFSFDNFMIIAYDYCFNLEIYLNPTKTMDELDKELMNFQIMSNVYNRIYYNEKLIDNESPGTKTNILMEYIVSSPNEVPLLIDQPEDNIDNHTIYSKLTEWFSKLKTKRQIVVVSHDANIVINSDSENLIIAKQEQEGIFKYTFGALEYDKNLEEAALILDGGVKAVKRRLNKYGD